MLECLLGKSDEVRVKPQMSYRLQCVFCAILASIFAMVLTSCSGNLERLGGFSSSASLSSSASSDVDSASSIPSASSSSSSSPSPSASPSPTPSSSPTPSPSPSVSPSPSPTPTQTPVAAGPCVISEPVAIPADVANNEPGCVEISTAADFDLIRSNPTGCFVQKNTIDLGGVTFTPIQNFSGRFYGKTHKIRNLTLVGTGSNTALFATLASGGLLRDVTLVNANVSGFNNTAPLVGTNSGTVYGCTASGVVQGIPSTPNYNYSWGYGGLVGFNNNTGGKVIASSSSVNLQMGGSYPYYYAVGGLIGRDACIAYQSYATGNISGAGYYAGGFAGLSEGHSKGIYATGNVSGSAFRGGLIGLACNQGTNPMTKIEEAWSSGSSNGGTSFGGIITWSNAVEILHVVTYGSGGSEMSAFTQRYGGTQVLTGLFYNSDVMGAASSAVGLPLTSAQMAIPANLTGYNFLTTWKQSTVNGFPILKWQP